MILIVLSLKVLVNTRSMGHVGACGLYGTWKVGIIRPMDLVFTSAFDTSNQSMRIGCVGKLGGQSGFLRHDLLNISGTFPKERLKFYVFTLVHISGIVGNRQKQ